MIDDILRGIDLNFWFWGSLQALFEYWHCGLYEAAAYVGDNKILLPTVQSCHWCWKCIMLMPAKYTVNSLSFMTRCKRSYKVLMLKLYYWSRESFNDISRKKDLCLYDKNRNISCSQDSHWGQIRRSAQDLVLEKLDLSHARSFHCCYWCHLEPTIYFMQIIKFLMRMLAESFKKDGWNRIEVVQIKYSWFSQANGMWK